MRRAVDYTGMRFGSCTAIEEIEKTPSTTERRYLCRCDCGATLTPTVSKLKRLRGCPRCNATKHGAVGTSEYATWAGIRKRCTNQQGKDWSNYGGRGISICDRWSLFENFLADMGPRPSPSHSIDRVDNDGDYEPGNCRWATKTEQNRNSRWTRLEPHEPEQIRWLWSLGYRGSEIARFFGISHTHAIRIRDGLAWTK